MTRLIALATLLAFVAFASLAIPQGIGEKDPEAKKLARQRATISEDAPWPAKGIKVQTFLAGNYLHRSDILLTRRDWSLASFAIRWATDSPFSHAALVFTGPSDEEGIDATFVIEAGTEGVDLTKLQDYLDDKSSLIAIKRFRGPWFDESKKNRVRGLLLDKIKATYNYWAIGRIVRTLWFGAQNTVQTKEETIETYREQNWTPPNEFICSGFVQIGFVETVLEYIDRGLLPPSALKEVVFHKEAASRLPEPEDWTYLDEASAKNTAELFKYQNIAELESVTPEDLATSDKLEWLYLIVSGRVYRVKSYEDVQRLMAE